MGFFGGSSQSTSSLVSSIDFSPVIQFGEDIGATQDKIVSQTQSVTPKLDDSHTASVGVLGGTGGAVGKSGDIGGEQPTNTEILPIGKGLDINPTVLYVAGAGIIVFLGFKAFSKKK